MELSMPKEYFRLAARFMKELGLYVYWMQYLNKGDVVKNFYDIKRVYKVSDVFGCTCFTDFLAEHNKHMPSGYCVYEVFSRYITEMYPHMSDMFEEKCPSKFITVDKEKKKITLNYD